MRCVLAIARLTFAEGMRMRVVLALLAVLVGVLLLLPAALKGDGTLAGRLQTFLSYSLSTASVCLSLTTIFFSCATLTHEFKSSTLHLVVTKPVTRIQILAGKWLGVNLLNVVMLAVCGLGIYAFAVAIKNRPETFRRDAINIRDVIWTARVAAVPSEPDFVQPAVEMVRERLARQDHVFPQGELAAVAEYARQLREEWKRIPPGQDRLYEFKGLLPPEREDTAFQLRFKLRTSPVRPDEKAPVLWIFLDPDTLTPLDEPYPTDGRVTETHQFLVLAKGVLRDGRAALVVANPVIPGEPPLNVVLDGDQALQLLYRVGGFELNYLKALLFILLRLAFLSALGLFFATFVSFPVACFCVCSLFVFCLFSSWLLEAVGANLEIRSDAIDPYGRYGPVVRRVVVPLLRYGFPDFGRYDGVEPLISGLYIRGAAIAQAAMHTLLYGVILLAAPGWLIFRTREVAEVQV